MRRNLIGVLVVLVILGGFLVLRLGGRQVARSTLDDTLAALPPGYTASHGATDYDALTDTLTIHDLVLNRGASKVGSAGTVVLKGAHLKALQAVFDADAYPDGHPAWTDRRPLLGHLDMKAVEIEPVAPGGVPVTIRHIVLDDLDGRPFIRPPTPANRGAADFQADAMAALAFHDFTVDGLAVDRDTRGHLGVGQLAMTGYDAGQFASGGIKDVEISVTQGTHPLSFSLANVAIQTADLRSLVSALGESAGEDPTARRKTMAAAYSGASIQQFDLDGLALKVSPGPRIGLASLHSDAGPRTGGVRSGSGTMRGLSIAADDVVMPPQAHMLLQRFGTDRLVLDQDTKASWDDTTQHLDLQQFDLTARDLATLHLTASLQGIDRAGMRSQDLKVRQAAIMKAVISHAALRYDDQSLAGRIIGVLAMQQNVSPEQVQAEAAVPLAGLSMLMPDQPDAAAQISAFLAHKHSLRITLDPPTPVSLGQVAAAPVAERAHMLGLKIEGD